MAITIECERPITPAQVRALLQQAPGVQAGRRRGAQLLSRCRRTPPARTPILVGRIRQDLSDPSGHSISLFVAGDQLLKGAALNAVQIAELLSGRGKVGPRPHQRRSLRR